MNRRILLALFLVALAAGMRLVPHPWNLTPVGAVALFSGACFERRWWSVLVPLVALLAGDVFIGFHVLMPVVYATIALIAVLGMLLRDRRSTPLAVAGAAIGSATLFYLTTNFAVWAILGTYPMTFAGLVLCYVAGIPFYGTQLSGDLLYSGLLFGTFVWAERRVPSFR